MRCFDTSGRGMYSLSPTSLSSSSSSSVASVQHNMHWDVLNMHDMCLWGAHGNRLPWQYKAMLHCCHVNSTFWPRKQSPKCPRPKALWSPYQIWSLWRQLFCCCKCWHGTDRQMDRRAAISNRGLPPYEEWLIILRIMNYALASRMYTSSANEVNMTALKGQCKWQWLSTTSKDKWNTYKTHGGRCCTQTHQLK